MAEEDERKRLIEKDKKYVRFVNPEKQKRDEPAVGTSSSEIQKPPTPQANSPKKNKPSNSPANKPAEKMVKESKTGTSDEEKHLPKSITDASVEVVDIKTKKGKSKTKSKDYHKRKKETLLDKALEFRQIHPQKWEQRQKENEKKVKESLGIFETNSFLEEYYQRLSEIQKEKEILEEKQRTGPGKLMLHLEYNEPRPTPLFKTHSVETYASIAANGLSIHEKEESFFDRFRSDKDEERGKEPELILTILKGKYLNNVLDNSEVKLKECRIKCKVFPDNEKQGAKMKSSYVECSYKGTVKWKHVFVLKGFTAEELSTKYVLLQLVGKSDSEKHTLAEIVLAGKNAEMSHLEHHHKHKISNVVREHWQSALSKPGKPLNVAFDIHPTSLSTSA